ncbi:MAG: hypothetical protein HKN16_04055, partial [Saprospiraceae bacterium]|nr:hypothetical protein [Saprospiraceae bacterium]
MGTTSPNENPLPANAGGISSFLLKSFFFTVAIGITMAFSWMSFEDLAFLNPNELENRTATNTVPCFSAPGYGLYLNNASGSNYFSFSSGSFIEYDDGTAVLTAYAENADDPDFAFDVEVTFSGRTFQAVEGAPKSNSCNSFPTDSWYYYTSTVGYLYGRQDYEGARLKVTRAGSPFQLGVGANVTDGGNVFDASGWLSIDILEHATMHRIVLNSGSDAQEGDFNFRLSGNPLQSCMNVTHGGEIAGPAPVCPTANDPNVIQSVSLPTGGAGELEYIWLSSTNGCPNDVGQAIPGATHATYDPGPISQTTWFRRCARRAGCDSWEFGESNCIKIEYFDNCGNPTSEGWTLTCEDGLSAEILGQGIRCQSSYTYLIPNPSDVVSVVAEVVYKGGTANPSSLLIQTNNESANVPAAYTTPANAYYFRTEFGPADRVILPTIPNSCKAQSLILYVFREGGQTTASTGRYVATWLYHSSVCETLEIPQAPATRDVEITVPLSEITTDGRIANIHATVVDFPSITTTVTIDDINMGDALNIQVLTLPDVPATASAIEICVESPYQTPTTPNGQSLVYSGGIKADPECKDCDDSDLSAAAEVISNYSGAQISCTGANDGRLQGLVSGGIPPFTYSWSNGDQGQIISDVGPGTYTVTITDQFGCEASGSVTIQEPLPFSANVSITADYNGQNISCFGANDGAIEAMGAGGTPPYFFQWGANGNYQTGAALQNLGPDTYEVLASDANGCIS